MLVIVIIGILVLIGAGARFAALRWFESANRRTHPRNANGIIVGAEAIDMPGESDAGVLLVHGFGDTPQTLRPVADHLHALGYGVLAPLLAGHGRSLREFVQSNADEWIAGSRTALDRLKGRYARVSIVGLSMGGAIAVILAAESRNAASLTLLSPYLTMPGFVRRVTRWPRVVNSLLPYFPGLGERSIRDPGAASESRAYGAMNAKVLGELTTIVDRASALLGALELPVLMIQSRRDNRITASAGARTFEQIGSANKKMVWISESGHVITVDRERGRVLAEIAEWLSETMPVTERSANR
jgi:carboxylesterase